MEFLTLFYGLSLQRKFDYQSGFFIYIQGTQVFSSYLSNLSLLLAFFLLTSQAHSSLKAEAELFAIQLYDNFPFSSLLSLHYYLLLPYFFCLSIMDHRQVLLHCILTYFSFSPLQPLTVFLYLQFYVRSGHRKLNMTWFLSSNTQNMSYRSPNCD